MGPWSRLRYALREGRNCPGHVRTVADYHRLITATVIRSIFKSERQESCTFTRNKINRVIVRLPDSESAVANGIRQTVSERYLYRAPSSAGCKVRLKCQSVRLPRGDGYLL